MVLEDLNKSQKVLAIKTDLATIFSLAEQLKITRIQTCSLKIDLKVLLHLLIEGEALVTAAHQRVWQKELHFH
ncbi:hypothetical protein Y1Q_0018475 [Alligator mississippiensis]|uniref:Uncharacterized protein n=1 Tax=Alligator mississippiensis TaxID=8496 RepID=A0A151PCS3_ALLMI|nr:hypothetical protein Y1Q_0018475 [Alligator mississippiensis]